MTNKQYFGTSFVLLSKTLTFGKTYLLVLTLEQLEEGGFMFCSCQEEYKRLEPVTSYQLETVIVIPIFC